MRGTSRFLRRVVLQLAVVVLVIGGVALGLVVGIDYWDNHYGWSVGLVACLIGLGAAFGSWFIAALLSLLVEMADSLREVVEHLAGPRRGDDRGPTKEPPWVREAPQVDH
jgi:MFS family permease